ncbi:hypothetical protein JTE90_020836 [Oedothorax gibbosus]|uniref:Uncharacterized protein n=1 Tax=Oedothorax gibbosus TaxID=931172 RepID=A0AAV6U038_9ARAC|nr:hypothetical protein JTE90_020836 [Oedothorax gibbosus]
MWCMLWYAFIKDDSPPEIKFNSESEEKASLKLKDVPFKNIVLSLPLLSLCLVFACPTLLNLSLMDLILFQNILNLEFLGYSSLIMNTVIFIPVAEFLIDKLMSRDKFKTSTIRKVLCAGGLVFHVLFVLLHTIENDITVPLCFYVAFLIMDLTVAGLIPNFLELSACYCVLIMGLVMTVTTVFSRLFDYVSEMTQQDTTSLESENVEYNFLMDQLPVWLTTIIGALLFAVFGSTEEQPWSSRSQPAIELLDDIEKNSKKEVPEEACNPHV